MLVFLEEFLNRNLPPRIKYAILKVDRDNARKKIRDLDFVIVGGLVGDRMRSIIGRVVIKKFGHDTVLDNGLHCFVVNLLTCYSSVTVCIPSSY